MDGRVVAESQHDPLVVLLEGEDLFGHVDLVDLAGGDHMGEQAVEIGARKHQPIVSSAAKNQ